MLSTTPHSFATPGVLANVAMAALWIATTVTGPLATGSTLTPPALAGEGTIAPIAAPAATVKYASTTEVAVIDFARVEQADPSAPHGSETVVSEGRDGSTQSVMMMTYVNGRASGIELGLTIEFPAIDEVVAIGTSPTASDVAANRVIGQDIAAQRGWTGGEWTCLDSLWARESGWRHTADNPNSSAYGIPQALPGSKMASAGADWATNPATQIAWGLSYVAARYGTPCGAWAHSQDIGWY